MGEMASAEPVMITSFAHSWTPPRRAVSDLVERAAAHPLGTAFIARGSLDAVSATFGVHAFIVEAARERLRSAGVR